MRIVLENQVQSVYHRRKINEKNIMDGNIMGGNVFGVIK